MSSDKESLSLYCCCSYLKQLSHFKLLNYAHSCFFSSSILFATKANLVALIHLVQYATIGLNSLVWHNGHFSLFDIHEAKHCEWYICLHFVLTLHLSSRHMEQLWLLPKKTGPISSILNSFKSIADIGGYLCLVVWLFCYSWLLYRQLFTHETITMIMQTTPGIQKKTMTSTVATDKLFFCD